MVGISLADIAALNADGLRQPEVMLTDDIAIGNNAVIAAGLIVTREVRSGR